MYATPSTPGTSGTVLTTAFVRRSITCKSPAPVSAQPCTRRRRTSLALPAPVHVALSVLPTPRMSRLRVADANVVRPEHLQLARRHDRRSSGDADERQYGQTAARYFVPSA